MARKCSTGVHKSSRANLFEASQFSLTLAFDERRNRFLVRDCSHASRTENALRSEREGRWDRGSGSPCPTYQRANSRGLRTRGPRSRNCPRAKPTRIHRTGRGQAATECEYSTRPDETRGRLAQAGDFGYPLDSEPRVPSGCFVVGCGSAVSTLCASRGPRVGRDFQDGGLKRRFS